MTPTPTLTPTRKAFTDTRMFKVMRTVVGVANPFVTRLLASRFGDRVAQALLLLEFRGRTSGKAFRTPVGYVRSGDRLVIVTSPTYRWWKNVVGGAPVRVRLPEGWRDGQARVLMPDDSAYDSAVATQVTKRGPRTLREFGVDVDDAGRIDPATKTTAPTHAHIVEILLAPSVR